MCMQNQFKNYKISIIIPNYNGKRFIGWCLESILTQKYENYEVIIVDGKSTDWSHAIIASYVQKFQSRIQWINVHDFGISHGFNLWIQASTGDFVILLGSDDYLYENILSNFNRYVNQVISYGYISIEQINIYWDAIVYWSHRDYTVERKVPVREFSKKNLIYYGNMIGFQNIFLNRSWVESNLIDETRKYAMDYEYYFRMLDAKQRFIYLPEIFTINYHWTNTSVRDWYKSGKESIKIALEQKFTIIGRVYILRRYFILVILRCRTLFSR